MEHFGISELVLISCLPFPGIRAHLLQRMVRALPVFNLCGGNGFSFERRYGVLDMRSVLLHCFSVLTPVCNPATFDG